MELLEELPVAELLLVGLPVDELLLEELPVDELPDSLSSSDVDVDFLSESSSPVVDLRLSDFLVDTVSDDFVSSSPLTVASEPVASADTRVEATVLSAEGSVWMSAVTDCSTGAAALNVVRTEAGTFATSVVATANASASTSSAGGVRAP